MAEELKRIDLLLEFWDKGYLLEANRQFFHPLGLALEIVKEEDGTAHLGGVWDYRNNPEGLLFAELDKNDIIKGKNIQKLWNKKAKARQVKYGFVIQPLKEVKCPRE